MTWTEYAVWFLVAERCFAMGLGFLHGAIAAYRAIQPQPRLAHTPVPPFVEVASDDVTALDYSSDQRKKRH
jgi:hypothetical protein